MLAFHTLGQAYYAIGDFSRAAELLRRNVEVADRQSGTPRTDVRLRIPGGPGAVLGPARGFAEGRRQGRRRCASPRWKAEDHTAHCLRLPQPTVPPPGDLEHAIRVFDQGLALAAPPAVGTCCQ